MADFLSQVGRSASEFAVRRVIDTTSLLSAENQRRTGRFIASIAGAVPVLRATAQRNMQLALGENVPREASRLYFRRIAWWLSNSLAAFHHGISATPVAEQVSFDETLRVVDETLAPGRGAVLATSHWCGHELLAGFINRKYPVALVIRQAASAERMARKQKWYSALGVEVVVRPARASAIKDGAAYLKILKKGKILAITPDLLASEDSGVAVELFGRRAHIFAGAFAIARAAQVPLLRSFPRWQSDSRVFISWSRAEAPTDTNDRAAAIAGAAQDWCRWFEEKLISNPQDWLFWLDKRWSRFLRTTPRQSPAQ
jgi:lauroyl/myristoyl acyltransferase